ncbi:MAG: SMC-Scp complex subunit ScpB [Candidatus Paceibacterota bacterium]
MLQQIVTLLYLSGDPLPITAIATLLQVKPEEVEANIEGLATALNQIGLALLRSNGELSIVTQSTYAPLVEAFWKEELSGELTPATLQVLTLVAYLGNATREQISYIRGVQSSQSVRTLTVRGLISRQAEVCVLTAEALKHLGVTTVEELPEYETIHRELKEKLEAREI